MSDLMADIRMAWQRFIHIGVAGLSIAVLCTLILLPRDAGSQTSTTPLTGWIWSDSTGWISLNCADVNPACPINYKVVVDQSGTLSGYGWSDSVGWVSFNITSSSGCPSGQSGNGSCIPSISSGTINGWARVCAGTAPGDCSTMNSRTDGWDGWISLKGTSPVAYGLTLASDGAITGYAWGSDVAGWTQFVAEAAAPCTTLTGPTYCGVPPSESANDIYQNDTLGNRCKVSTCPWQCGGGACLSPTPSCSISAEPPLVAAGATTTIVWSSGNAISCTVSGNGNNWSGTSGSQVSNPVSNQTIYTQNCIGPDSASTCTATTQTIGSPVFREI